MAVKTFSTDEKNTKLSTNFKVSDFWSNSAYRSIKLETELANVFEKFYAKFNIKPRMANANYGRDKTYTPTKTAGYRLPKSKGGDWGGSTTSKHCFGCAVDVEVPGISAYALAQFAETLSEIAGIGLYSDSNGHIHIDYVYNKLTNPSGRKSRTYWWKVTSNSKTPGFGGIPTVFKSGQRSKAIADIQTYLNKAGYPCGSADGVFGAKTQNALKAWQKANALSADGVFGKQTNEKMKLFKW